jgi:non-specific serine/threonine protein kinase
LKNASAFESLEEIFRSELRIPDFQEKDFLDKYLLDLARVFELEGDLIEFEEITETPVPRLYLSDQSGELQAQLRFGYGESEVFFDSSYPETSQLHQEGSWKIVRIQRDPVAEEAASKKLSSASYSLKRLPMAAQPGIYRLRARTHPVDFLLHRVPRIIEGGFEIYGEQQLKTARVNRQTPTISFSVSSEIDWFDVQAIVNFGELQVSLKDIHKALKKRERFIKLADGSIGEIPEEWLDKYRHLWGLAETSDKGFRVSQHQLALIEELLASADTRSTDAAYDQMLTAFKTLSQPDFQGIPARNLPTEFTGELRPYQKSGYDWLHFLKDYQLGGCLADDMGLGKTVQALVFLQDIYSKKDPKKPSPPASLLVVPKSLLINWQRESARFTPQLRILEYFAFDRNKDLNEFNDTDLVITTYGVMLRDISHLHAYRFEYIVLDESQAIKNPASQTARAARLLQGNHKLVLTGTPVENSTVELWSQFSFLNPGLLGSLDYFKSEFASPIERKNDTQALDLLRRMVYPFVLRRTKAQVAPELPPRTERILTCDMEPAQRKFYNRTRDIYRGMVLGLIDKGDVSANQMKILEGLLRLRQISNHPLLYDEKFRGESGKFNLLFETLDTLQQEGHKVLIFSQFVQMLSLVRQKLDNNKIAYTYLDGQTQNRQAQVDLFQNSPDIPFFLISLKAGGIGLNLTAADYVIHIDPWWNPAVEMQASDRTHRIGQDKPVFVFKLITQDSVEEKILVLQERKKNLVDQLITTESSFFKSLTSEDLKDLFS